MTMVWRILDSFIEFRATDSIGHASWFYFVLFFIVLFLIVIRTCSFRARARIIRVRARPRLWRRVW